MFDTDKFTIVTFNNTVAELPCCIMNLEDTE